jgi:hypothetical protein
MGQVETLLAAAGRHRSRKENVRSHANQSVGRNKDIARKWET